MSRNCEKFLHIDYNPGAANPWGYPIWNAIDVQRDELIGRIEKQLCQHHTLKPMFTFRWRLA